MKESLERAIEIARELERRKSTNRLEDYVPYKYQMKFHNSHATQKLLMAGNRVGKSLCGAMEMAIHLTGKYPDWWEGKRYKEPIVAWCGGVSNESTRDILQAELLGAPGDPACLGTGAIPRANIITTERKPSVPNAVSIV